MRRETAGPPGAEAPLDPLAVILSGLAQAEGLRGPPAGSQGTPLAPIRPESGRLQGMRPEGVVCGRA